MKGIVFLQGEIIAEEYKCVEKSPSQEPAGQVQIKFKVLFKGEIIIKMQKWGEVI
jgi:hypothetical protein